MATVYDSGVYIMKGSNNGKWRRRFSGVTYNAFKRMIINKGEERKIGDRVYYSHFIGGHAGDFIDPTTGDTIKRWIGGGWTMVRVDD